MKKKTLSAAYALMLLCFPPPTHARPRTHRIAYRHNRTTNIIWRQKPQLATSVKAFCFAPKSHTCLFSARFAAACAKWIYITKVSKCDTEAKTHLSIHFVRFISHRCAFSPALLYNNALLMPGEQKSQAVWAAHSKRQTNGCTDCSTPHLVSAFFLLSLRIALVFLLLSKAKYLSIPYMQQ